MNLVPVAPQVVKLVVDIILKAIENAVLPHHVDDRIKFIDLLTFDFFAIFFGNVQYTFAVVVLCAKDNLRQSCFDDRADLKDDRLVKDTIPV